MHQPGKFRDRITLLTLTQDGTQYTWAPIVTEWANAERQTKNTIFSNIGWSAKTVKFTIRKRPITTQNAFIWNSRHCYITDIIETPDKGFLEITAVLVTPRTCTVKRSTTTKDAFNRPVHDFAEVLRFPGCLIEKYAAHNQAEPFAQSEMRYVLVTPKVIALDLADLVEIDGTTYNLQIAHTLDEDKNEYVISVREDT